MTTMGDVARIAGVSASTVSHVLNCTRNVDTATRARVEAAIEETGYRRNVVARSLAAGRTHTVGLSISALTNPYFGSLVHAVEKALSDAGYVLVVGDSHDDVESENRVTDSLLGRQVDGMIVAPAAGSERTTLPGITGTGTPLVLIDRGVDIGCDQVGPENTATARADRAPTRPRPQPDRGRRRDRRDLVDHGAFRRRVQYHRGGTRSPDADVGCPAGQLI